MLSPSEEKVLKIIGRKKLMISEITDRFYRTDAPFAANNRVASIIRRINNKCEYNRTNWFLNGSGCGRAGRLIWKDIKMRVTLADIAKSKNDKIKRVAKVLCKENPMMKRGNKWR